MRTIPSTLLQNDQPLDDGLDMALAFANANRDSLENFAKRKKSDLERVNSELDQVRKKRTWIPGAIVGGVTGLISLFCFSSSNFILGGILVVGGGGGSAYLIHDMRKKKEQKIVELSAEQQSIPLRPVPQVVSHLGKVHYVANVVEFEQQKLVLDSTGTRPKQLITYPEIPNGVERLQKLTTTLTEIPEELPILLPPSGQADLQQRARLTGVEADIEEGLSLTNQIFVDTSSVETEIPAFSNTSDVVYAIRQLADHAISEPPRLHLGQSDVISHQAMEFLEETAKEFAEAKELGDENVEALMTNAVHQLDHHVTRTSCVRDYSLSTILSSGLDSLKGIYDYPLTRFYCPKCHAVEEYHRSKLPIPLDEIGQASSDNLEGFYRNKDMQKIRDLIESIQKYLNQAQQQGEQLTPEVTRMFQHQLSHYQKRLKDLALEIAEFDPRAEVHKRNAILKYNISRKEWVCQLCSEKFSDREAQMSRMLKVKDDLILPIWDSLWLEKHDEANRILREKESELRDNLEKELALLRDEVRLFTEEFRPVRDRLEETSDTSSVAKEQLNLMFRFYEERNIVSATTLQEMRNYITYGKGSNLSIQEVIRMTAQLETHLRQEAEAGLIRRNELQDYVYEVRNATKYFALMPSQEQNLS